MDRVEAREVSLIRRDVRTNEEIDAPEVRLIDSEGEQLGIVTLQSALERAQGKSLDLVEVAPEGNPPVCRIMDYAHHVYEQKRIRKEQRKKATRLEMKELKLRPNIDPHDFGIKAKQAIKFLDKGHKVKITIRYRARELRHYEIGTEVMNRMAEAVQDVATVDAGSRGRDHARAQSLILIPLPKKAAVSKKSGDEQPAEA